jgi:four helix bundle protein
MDTNSGNKYDLDRRTFIFAKNVRDYVDKLPGKITNNEIGKQLIRSAGSVGANYIEANEALSKKDFIMRIKICKKEAKETRYWLELSTPNRENIESKSHLMGESTELIKIFATIVNKVKLYIWNLEFGSWNLF